MHGMLSRTNTTIEKVFVELERIRVKATSKQRYSVAIRCLELQGKYLGMFSNRIEQSEAIEDVSTEKIMQLIRELAEAGDIDLLELVGCKTPH